MASSLSTPPHDTTSCICCEALSFRGWRRSTRTTICWAVRRVTRRDDLPQQSKPLLDKFVCEHLLVSNSHADGDVVEVALESLFASMG